MNTQNISTSALSVVLILNVVLISGCIGSNDTPSKTDYVGFNNEFEKYWYDVFTSTQTKYNRQFFLGYKIDEHSNPIISTTNYWFNFEPYQQHQLLTNIGTVYNGMRVKYGLHEGNVILKDTVGGEICRYIVWGNIECKY